MKIAQHVPAYVDVRGAQKTAEFETIEELLTIPWVAAWTDTYRDAVFCKSENCGWWLLMIDGKRTDDEDKRGWWVIGYLDDGANVDLPVWRGP